MLYLGIDPGQSGGLAWMDTRGVLAFVCKMPATLADIGAEIERRCADTEFATIENVHSMPKQGVSSTFKFGQNFGALLMALTAHGVPHHLVTPQCWQKRFGLIVPRSKNWTATQKKNTHKAEAQRRFPYAKVTHATADAILIAEFCRITNQSRTNP